MSSFFTLELDTTQPEINIVAPIYTVPNIITEIYVEANEPLAEWQEVYVVDSYGNRHDLIFSNQGSDLLGLVDFNICPLGIVTLYAQVRDEVNNLSALVSKSIHLRRAAKIKVEITEQVRTVLAVELNRGITGTDGIRQVMSINQSRIINDTWKVRDLIAYEEKAVV